MKPMLLVLSILALTNVSIAQHCATQTIGTQTLTRCQDGTRITGQQIGGTTFWDVRQPPTQDNGMGRLYHALGNQFVKHVIDPVFGTHYAH